MHNCCGYRADWRFCATSVNIKQCEHTKYHIKDTSSNTRSSIMSKYKIMLLSTNASVTNRDVQLLTYLFLRTEKYSSTLVIETHRAGYNGSHEEKRAATNNSNNPWIFMSE